MCATLEVLIDESDNLGLIRLLAALGVVFGHSFALAMGGRSGLNEPVTMILPGTYSGSIAVECFFFISGLLITHSLLRNDSFWSFAKARVLRVMPAFLVMVLLTTLVLVPLVSRLSYSAYLSDPQTWIYLLRNIGMDVVLSTTGSVWVLPGAFESHNNAAVNGSLWSLFAEVRLYGISLLVALVGAYRFPIIGKSLAWLGLIYVLQNGAWIGPQHADQNALAMYALGALTRFYAPSLSVSVFPAILAILLVYFMRFAPQPAPLYALLIASVVIVLAFHPMLPKISLPGDYSYGVFLWGYPIQQMISHMLPSFGPYRMFVLSALLSLLAGVLSWHYIEKPALSLKRARMPT